jgi:transcriptional regulator with XRE-family HTH domain
MDGPEDQAREPLQEGFSATLRRLRLEAGLSREELAERGGVSESYLAKLEQGKRFPSPKVLRGIAHAVGVSPRELIEMAEQQGMADHGPVAADAMVSYTRPTAQMPRRSASMERRGQTADAEEPMPPGERVLVPSPWLTGLGFILGPLVEQGRSDLLGGIERVARRLADAADDALPQQTLQILEQLLEANQPPELMSKLLGVALAYLRDIERISGEQVELTRLLDIAATLLHHEDGAITQIAAVPVDRDHYVWLTALGLDDEGEVWIDPLATAHRAGIDDADPRVRRRDDGRIQVDLSRLESPELPPRDPRWHRTRAQVVRALDRVDLPLSTYEATLISIEWERAVTIEVAPAPLGERDGEFPASHRNIHIVTAHNPAPHVLPAEENARRNEQLLADIQKAGMSWRPASGLSADPHELWEERSFALLDVDRAIVIELARKHDQAAIFEWTPDQRAVVLCSRADQAHEEAVKPSGWHARWS